MWKIVRFDLETRKMNSWKQFKGMSKASIKGKFKKEIRNLEFQGLYLNVEVKLITDSIDLDSRAQDQCRKKVLIVN